jgi:hypothetical protein
MGAAGLGGVVAGSGAAPSAAVALEPVPIGRRSLRHLCGRHGPPCHGRSRRAQPPSSPWTNSTSPTGRSSSGPSARHIARLANHRRAPAVTAADVGGWLLERIPLVGHTLRATPPEAVMQIAAGELGLRRRFRGQGQPVRTSEWHESTSVAVCGGSIGEHPRHLTRLGIPLSSWRPPPWASRPCTPGHSRPSTPCTRASRLGRNTPALLRTPAYATQEGGAGAASRSASALGTLYRTDEDGSN